MLNWIASYGTNLLIRHRVIEKNQKDIYYYGFELMISTSFAIISILLMSFFLQKSEISIVFLLCFISIRLFSGGFHADTYGKCFLLTNSLFLICCILVSAYGLLSQKCWMVLLLISAIYIWRNAPVEHVQNPLNPDKIKKNKRNTHKVIVVVFICIMLAYLLGFETGYKAAIISIAMAAFLMFLSKMRALDTSG